MSAQDTVEIIWTFFHEGRVYGPASTSKIQELCRAGTIHKQTKVSSSAWKDWVDASSVGALRAAMSERTAEEMNTAILLEGIQSHVCKTTPNSSGRSLAFEFGRLLIILLVASIGIGVLSWLVTSGGPDDLFSEFTPQVRIQLAFGATASIFVRGALIGSLFGTVALLPLGESRRRWFRITFCIGAGLVVVAGILPIVSAQRMKTDFRHFGQDAVPVQQTRAD